MTASGASAALIMSEEKANELGLTPRARFHSFAVVGDDPLLMLTGPIPATRRILERSGLGMDDLEQVGGKNASLGEMVSNLSALGVAVPDGFATTAEAYQSVNPAAIVLLAPLIGMLFTRRAGRFPSTIMKFAISVLIGAALNAAVRSLWPHSAADRSISQA